MAVSNMKVFSVAMEMQQVAPCALFIYRQFNIQQFYVLPTQLHLCVLCGSQNKQPLFPYATLTARFL